MGGVRGGRPSCGMCGIKFFQPSSSCPAPPLPSSSADNADRRRGGSPRRPAAAGAALAVRRLLVAQLLKYSAWKTAGIVLSAATASNSYGLRWQPAPPLRLLRPATPAAPARSNSALDTTNSSLVVVLASSKTPQRRQSHTIRQIRSHRDALILQKPWMR